MLKDDPTECDRLEARLASIEARYDDAAPQTWDDILELQDDATITQARRDADERERILEELQAKECD